MTQAMRMAARRERGATTAYSRFEPLNSPIAAKGDHDPTASAAVGGYYSRYPYNAMLTKSLNGWLWLFWPTTDNPVVDYSVTSIQGRYSTNNGTTWSRPYEIVTNGSFVSGTNWVTPGWCVTNTNTGRMHFLYTQWTNGGGDGTPGDGSNSAAGEIYVYHKYSDTHGLTWSSATDVTSSVRKSSGQAAPFDEFNLGHAFFNVTGGYFIKAGAYAGRVVFVAYHRYTADKTGECWCNSFYTDNDGSSWSKGYGLRETTAGNDGAQEPRAAVYNADGDALVTIRKKSATPRYTSALTEGGTVWSDMAAQASIPSYDCMGDICSFPVGTTYPLYMAVMGDTGTDGSERSHLRIYKSADAGATWATSRLIEGGQGSYPTIVPVDSGSLFMAAEHTFDVVNAVANNFQSKQYIGGWKIPKAWLDNTALQPLYAHWVFNEHGDAALYTTGKAYKDRGTLGCHAQGASGGSIANGVLSCSGAAVAVVLDEFINSGATNTTGNRLDIRVGDSMTWEFQGLTGSGGTAKAFYDSRNAAGAGVTFASTTSSRGVFTVRDVGGNQVAATTTSGRPIFNGQRHDVVVVFTRGVSLAVYIDGVLDTTATSGASSTTGLIKGSQNHVLGSRADGTNGAAITFEAVRITHAAKTDTSDFLTSSSGRTTLASYYGYTVTTPSTSPTNLASAKMLLLPTYDQGWSVSKDVAGGHDKPAMPIVRGQGIGSGRDPVSSKLFTFGASSHARGARYDEDSVVGPHWQLSYGSSAAGYVHMTSAELNAYLDFVQNTGVFTIAMIWNVHEAASGVWSLLDMCNQTTNPGFSIFSTGSTNMTLYAYGSGVLISEAFTIPARSADQWYFTAFVGRKGTSDNPLMYHAAMPGSLAAPTLTTATTASGAWGATGTYNSTQPLAIGARGDGVSGNTSVRVKNVFIGNAALTMNELQTMVGFGVAY